MARFDEVELAAGPMQPLDDVVVEVTVPTSDDQTPAPRFRRLLALLTDLSLFAALVLALAPLLPQSRDWLSVAALGGFVVVVSYYYYVGSWLLWGKTIGGAIFDVRVVSTSVPAMPLRSATRRWIVVYLGLATAGLGFLFADRISSTRCVSN
ncbi:MAG: hypothetical protein QOI24_4518 [Acidobacteriota bacterium]|jgi:hypothetical protein|nr:hypothetical protein [Acidobacteriota bacterium]